MTVKTKRLMVMAGGSGGHIFPGLTVAHHLMAQGWQIRWLGTANRMEANLVPQQGINIDLIYIRGDSNKSQKQLLAPWNIWRVLRQARRIIHAWRPDVVLGMGGYISGFGGLAAWSYGIPMVIHEQNSVAGMTNWILAKIANKVLQGFDGALPHADLVGNPVRNTILTLPAPEVRFRYRSGPIRVLILGGSQGALILNQTMPAVAARLGGTLTLWHQVGKGALKAVNYAYAVNGETQHKVAEFIDDIATAYAWADVVVCRAGALTVSEIAAAGLPALFIPFIHKDYHQYWNARQLEQAGAAKIINQLDVSVICISDVLASWDRSILLTMAQRARATAISNATERVAQKVAAVVRS